MKRLSSLWDTGSQTHHAVGVIYAHPPAGVMVGASSAGVPVAFESKEQKGTITKFLWADSRFERPGVYFPWVPRRLLGKISPRHYAG